MLERYLFLIYFQFKLRSQIEVIESVTWEPNAPLHRERFTGKIMPSRLLGNLRILKVQLKMYIQSIILIQLTPTPFKGNVYHKSSLEVDAIDELFVVFALRNGIHDKPSNVRKSKTHDSFSKQPISHPFDQIICLNTTDAGLEKKIQMLQDPETYLVLPHYKN